MTAPEPAPGQAFRDTLRERWIARNRCVDMRDYADLPQEDRDDLEAAAQAAITAALPEHVKAALDDLAAPEPKTAPGVISTSFTWDYRQPAPMDEIAVRVRELSGGTVTMSMPETGGDEYELVITRHEPEPAPDPAAAMREARGYREALQQIARNDGFDLARDHNAKIARRALEGK